MSEFRRQNCISIYALILVLFLAAVPDLGIAQADSVEIPANAHAKNYGDGWVCERGYRKVDKACDPIKVPAKAYLNSSGDN